MIAASRGDTLLWLVVAKHFDDGLAGDSKRESALYLWFILRFRVIELVGRRPAADDLHAMAQRAFPRYSGILRLPVGFLEDTLRAYLRIPPAGEQPAGSYLFLSAAAAGVLLEDPAAELISIRPRVARWRFRDGQGTDDANQPPAQTPGNPSSARPPLI
jgi:hypothetical protein